MKQLLFLLFLSSAFLASCQQAGTGNASSEAIAAKADVVAVNKVLPLEAYKTKMSELGANRQLIDVRTPEEYSQGHIDGAVNINFYDDDFAQQLEQKLQKEKPVMLYCRSGSRSAQSAEQLKALGFKEVYDLEGGFMAWK
ncbi:MAG: rhodanese-like domain-containing protein [Phaeodactylibacter sp.]|nr:rhodanese-like domain-containing protein [Phaeodactylibacter sp.]